MAAKNFPVAIAKLGPHEGGWADHPRDPGGATMKGVTLDTYRAYMKSDATKADLRRITDDEVRTIYKRQYWDKIWADKLPSGVDYCMFDFGVNSGPSRSVKYVQRIVGAKADGVMGPNTLAAINEYDPVDLINRLSTARQRFVESLSTFDTFGNGWTRRISEVRKSSLDMVGKATVVTVSKPKDEGKTKTVSSGNIWIALIKALIAAFSR